MVKKTPAIQDMKTRALGRFLCDRLRRMGVQSTFVEFNTFGCVDADYFALHFLHLHFNKLKPVDRRTYEFKSVKYELHCIYGIPKHRPIICRGFVEGGGYTTRANVFRKQNRCIISDNAFKADYSVHSLFSSLLGT